MGNENTRLMMMDIDLRIVMLALVLLLVNGRRWKIVSAADEWPV